MSNSMHDRLQAYRRQGDQRSERARDLRSNLRKDREQQKTDEVVISDEIKNTKVYQAFTNKSLNEQQKRDAIREQIIISFENSDVEEQKLEIEALNVIFKNLSNEIFKRVDEYLEVNEDNPLSDLNDNNDQTYQKYIELKKKKKELDEPLDALRQVMDEIVDLYEDDRYSELKAQAREKAIEDQRAAWEQAQRDEWDAKVAAGEIEEGTEFKLVGKFQFKEEDLDLSIYIEDIENEVTDHPQVPRSGADISREQALIYCLTKATSVKEEKERLEADQKKLTTDVTRLEKEVKAAKETIEANRNTAIASPSFFGGVNQKSIDLAKAVIKENREFIDEKEPLLREKTKEKEKIDRRLEVIEGSFAIHEKVLGVLNITDEKFEKDFSDFIKLTRSKNEETKKALAGIERQMDDSLVQTKEIYNLANNMFKEIAILGYAVQGALNESDVNREKLREILGADADELIQDTSGLDVDLGELDEAEDFSFDDLNEDNDGLGTEFNKMFELEKFRSNSELVDELSLLKEGLTNAGRDLSKTRTAVKQMYKSFRNSLHYARLDASQLSTDVGFSAGVSIGAITQLAGMAKQALARGTMDEINEQAIKDYSNLMAQTLSFLEARVKIAEDSVRTTAQIHEISEAAEEITADIQDQMDEKYEEVAALTEKMEATNNGLNNQGRRRPTGGSKNKP